MDSSFGNKFYQLGNNTHWNNTVGTRARFFLFIFFCCDLQILFSPINPNFFHVTFDDDQLHKFHKVHARTCREARTLLSKMQRSHKISCAIFQGGYDSGRRQFGTAPVGNLQRSGTCPGHYRVSTSRHFTRDDVEPLHDSSNNRRGPGSIPWRTPPQKLQLQRTANYVSIF